MGSERLTKDSLPEDFTLALALVDAVPVVFFGLNGILLYHFFPKLLLLLGAILCMVSGLIKVLWKVIVAVGRKNIWPLFIQMRIAMPIGFLMMILSVILWRNEIDWQAVGNAVLSFPAVIFIILDIVGMLLMIIFSFALNNKNKKANWIEQGTNGIAQICLFVALLILACTLTACSVDRKTEGQTETTVTETTVAETTVAETTEAEETESETEDPFKDVDLTDWEEAVMQKRTLPVINITTEEGVGITSKEEYVYSRIDVFNCDESYELTANGGVKVRGNSTAEGSDKPYRIKFDSKQGMLGLHDGKAYKSWVLLLSYWNLAPDYVGFSAASAICEGKYYVSDFTYVNVYVNQKYKGIYVLCEQNQAAEDRIDVYEPKEDETQTEIGYVLEMDNYADEEHPFFTLDYDGISMTDIDGETRQLEEDDYSIKSDTTCDEQREFIAKYLKGIYEIAYHAIVDNEILMFNEDYEVVSGEGVYATGQEAVEAVVDTESLIDMMIVQELVHNYDVGAGSFYMAIDFSPESKYQKLTFLAPWDFNWAYYEDNHEYYACTFQALQNDHYDRSNYWYILFMQADWFREETCEQWTYIRENNILKNAMNEAKAGIATTENDLGENDSWKVWTGEGLADFVLGRADWLDKQWLIKTEEATDETTAISDETAATEAVN